MKKGAEAHAPPAPWEELSRPVLRQGRRVAEKIDWVATYTNAITSGIFGMWRVSLPITMPDDRRALQAAIRGCAQPPDQARMVFISDTLTLDHIWVSPNLAASVEQHPRLRVVEEIPLSFCQDGSMSSPWRFS